jgi:NAD(P)-dependent dehydrogenase (short-subunit alcohol dehydrogenase family)
MPDLAGKRLLVIGGETEAGQALAGALAEAGAAIAIASLTQETGAEFAVNSALNELWALGREGIALVIDASDGEELSRGIAQAEREIGRLDAACVAGEGVALEALRSALGERPVVEIEQDVSVQEALASLGAAL